jgi:uncharacterized heparinase superfamily protein
MSMCGPDCFSFLNQTHTVPDKADWNAPALEKLWLYNLHYFDDLNAENAAERHTWHQSLLARWVAENPPGQGNGWEPYPTSLRIVNWIKWAAAGNALSDECVQSLAVQTRWLTQRLEWHILGNHLFENAKALVFAGLFFQGLEADGWRAKGLAILARQIPEQVLADGGHFERSPMYHAIILEDILDLINAAGAWPARVAGDVTDEWKRVAERMLTWMQAMSHPDGDIAFFNDAALGIASNLKALAAYAARLGIRTHGVAATGVSLPDSGFVRLENPHAVALLDVAPVGPDYLPGHAHADTLSFELSLFGQRIIVNGGTSCYGTGAQRLTERGTAAQSTVEINGQNSSEVWSGFRVARRAYPFALHMEKADNASSVACSHDGYRRSPGKPIHRRHWSLEKNSLVICDTVTGPHVSAVARFHLHPGVRIEADGDQRWHLHWGDGSRVALLQVLDGTAHLAASTYSPEFGVVIPSHCVVVRLLGCRATTVISWLRNDPA